MLQTGTEVVVSERSAGSQVGPRRFDELGGIGRHIYRLSAELARYACFCHIDRIDMIKKFFRRNWLLQAKRTESLERVNTSPRRYLPYGFALFHPASTGALQPRSVGFSAELGFWHPIAHLRDLLSLGVYGLKASGAALDPPPSEGFDMDAENSN